MKSRNLLKIFYALLFFICIILSSQIAFSKNKKIYFEGISEDLIKNLKTKHSSLFQNEPTPSNVDRIIKVIYSSGNYSSLSVYEKISQDGSTIFVIKGEQRKIIEDITISEVPQIPKNDLLNQIDIKQGAAFNKKNIELNINKLKKYLQDQGFLSPKIEYEELSIDSFKMKLNFKITEGVICKIKNIEYISQNQDLNRILSRKTNHYLQQPLTELNRNNLNVTITNYLRSENFLNANISDIEIQFNESHSMAIFMIHIDEPFRFELFFEGNIIYPEENIRKVTLQNLKDLGQDPIWSMVENIKNFYQKNGFNNIHVQYRIQVDNNQSTKRVTFEISEGTQLKIDKVKIGGRISRPYEYYLDLINQKTNVLKPNMIFYQPQIETELNSLVASLQNEGYFHVKITHVKYDFNTEKNLATINILIDEGPLTLVNRIQFSGNTIFSDKDLKDVLSIQIGQPLLLSKIEEDLKALTEFYQNQGYLEMHILNENQDLIQYDPTNTQAHLHFKLHEGPKIVVRSISVEGNLMTKEYVILNSLNFSQGDILTPSNISDSVSFLQRTGLFSKVEIRSLEENSTVSSRHIIISVIEKDPGLFEIGFGVNNERKFTLRGFTGIAYRNLLGTGRSLSSHLELNSNIVEEYYLEHKVTASYMEPFLFGRSTNGRVNLIRNQDVDSYDATSRKLTITENNEIILLAEKDFSKHIKGTWTLWGLSSVKTRVTSYQLFPSSVVQQIATIGPSLFFDYRDDPFIPTQGHYSRFFIQYAHPEIGSSTGIEFIKGTYSFSHYLPIGVNKIIWANSIRGGYLKNLNETGSIPAAKMFRIGGRATLRGFEYEVIPSKEELNVFNSPDFDVKRDFKISTESSEYVLKSELRIPIMNSIGFSLFYDGGAVTIAGMKFNDTYRDALGFGVNFMTPVGSVNLELGFKLDKKPNESESRFHFSIGSF